MSDFNKVIIVGNLTRDPELRYVPNGQAVANLRVATNRVWTAPDGERKEEVEYHSVVLWGKLAEIASRNLSKGRKVLIEGRLRTRSWEGQDGTKRQTTEIIAENISFLDRKQEIEPSIESTPSEEVSAKIESVESIETDKNEEKIDLDDIPF